MRGSGLLANSPTTLLNGRMPSPFCRALRARPPKGRRPGVLGDTEASSKSRASLGIRIPKKFGCVHINMTTKMTSIRWANSMRGTSPFLRPSRRSGSDSAVTVRDADQAIFVQHHGAFMPGWGAKSTAAVLAKFGHLESIPEDSHEWHVDAANAGSLAATLARERDRALLFRTLATLRTDIPLFGDVEELRWAAPMEGFDVLSARIDAAISEPRRRRIRRS